MGEGARRISDEWEREVERPGLNEAQLISCGTAQNCGSPESRWAGIKAQQRKKPAYKRITIKPASRNWRALSFERHPHFDNRAFAPTL